MRPPVVLDIVSSPVSPDSFYGVWEALDGVSGHEPSCRDVVLVEDFEKTWGTHVHSKQTAGEISRTIGLVERMNPRGNCIEIHCETYVGSGHQTVLIATLSVALSLETVVCRRPVVLLNILIPGFEVAENFVRCLFDNVGYERRVGVGRIAESTFHREIIEIPKLFGVGNIV